MVSALAKAGASLIAARASPETSGRHIQPAIEARGHRFPGYAS
jgi:hypothetical protein